MHGRHPFVSHRAAHVSAGVGRPAIAFAFSTYNETLARCCAGKHSMSCADSAGISATTELAS